MERLLKAIPIVVAIGALGLAYAQRGEIAALRKQLDQLTPSDDGDPAGDSSPPPVASGGPSDAALTRRIAALERTTSRIFQMLMNRGGEDDDRGARPAGAPVHKSLSNLRSDVDALLTGEAINTDEGRKRLHEIVKKATQQAREERWEQRRQRHEARAKTRLDKFARENRLDARQAESLGKLLGDERNQRRQLFRAARNGEKSFPEAISEIRKQRQATDGQVKSLLSGDQYGAYEKMREESRWGRRGR